MLNQSVNRAIGMAVLGAATLVAVVSAQANRPQGDGMDQLLSEVRGLRSELAQAAGASMRMQLLLARLSLQEQRITALNRQASELQQQLSSVTRGRTASGEHLERLSTLVQSGAIPAPEQKDIEYEVSALKMRISEQQQEEQRLQNQVAEVSRVIAAEQGHWMDFNSRLDELERALRWTPEPTNPRTTNYQLPSAACGSQRRLRRRRRPQWQEYRTRLDNCRSSRGTLPAGGDRSPRRVP